MITLYKNMYSENFRDIKNKNGDERDPNSTDKRELLS